MAKVMPKTSVAPKSAIKLAPATDAKASEKAAKEKEKAERAALIAAEVEDGKEKAEAITSASASMRDAFIDFRSWGIEKVEEHGFTKEEVTALVRASFAEAGGYDAEELDKGAKVESAYRTDYTYSSRVVGLIFAPKEHKKATDKLLARIEKGENISLATLENVAKKGLNPDTVAAGPGSGAHNRGEDSSKNKFEDKEAASNALSEWVKKAQASGFDLEDIEEIEAENLALWKQADDEAEAA